MNTKFRALRLKQLHSSLKPWQSLTRTPPPARGWLRAIREALGLSQKEVAKRTKVVQQSIAHFENAEASGRITLNNLRRVADALGCELVYAIVPKQGTTIAELAERPARAAISKQVRAVEHTMALENQAVGGIDRLIKDEVARAKRSRK